ncbi:GH23236 [Drosophila grimshawi]|uniref:GH23236 n=1 Tax=Drosophila grimshawi TaxID=7222 RepID=B4K128_DROGR|nr:GH23236 [Drosophila grimshawi]
MSTHYTRRDDFIFDDEQVLILERRITDSASSSISSQVDAAARLAGYAGHATSWKTTPIATTKITSPHSLPVNQSTQATSTPYSHYGNHAADEMATSVFCSSNGDGQEHDLFDSNYPDLLDIAKYAVAQAAQTGHAYPPTGTAAANGGLCTLPRKLKHSGKYFRNSSDSQSPLLADNSSKYGSSTLGDGSFLNEAIGLGRRYSAESSYANYASTTTYTGGGQRANSFLNLVQSGAHKSGIHAHHLGQKPSLPSSPVQHQRSLSSAATPLLDFSALATRAAGANIFHMNRLRSDLSNE